LNSSARKVAEARAIEHARHADDLAVRQAGELAHHPHHRVERVGDDDDEGVRGMRLDASPTVAIDLGVDADQVVAAHACLRGTRR
jgi:hypothetical protein